MLQSKYLPYGQIWFTIDELEVKSLMIVLHNKHDSLLNTSKLYFISNTRFNIAFLFL